jgi:hypothetical protein
MALGGVAGRSPIRGRLSVNHYGNRTIVLFGVRSKKDAPLF